MVVGDIPRRNAFRYPDEPGIESESLSLRWSEVNDRVNRLARGLSALGLRKSERIALLAPNSAELVETYFAAAKLGLVIVPMHGGLLDQEIAFLLKDAEAAAVLVDGEVAEKYAGAINSVASVKATVVLGGSPNSLTYEQLLDGGSAGEPETSVGESDLLAIRYTSGTTGLPKGVPSTHRDWLTRSINFLAHVPHSQRDRALLVAPFSVGLGSSLLTTYSYVAARISIMRRFDATKVLQRIEASRITTFQVGAPSLFGALIDDPSIDNIDASSLRLVGYGGSVFPVPLLLRTLKRFPCDFFGVYGSLEAGGFSTYLLPGDHRLDGVTGVEREKRLAHLRSCGREALQADVRVVDDEGREVPRATFGEMIVRTEGMASSYWKRPGEMEKLLRNGWFFTGDGASIDEDGYIYISDRLKDVIKTGGLNVSSIEIENALLSHAAVVEAAVIGVPDPRWGEAVVAVVVCGAAVEEAGLLAHCRAQLGRFKVPKRIEFVDSLPKNTTGKVLKRDLRQRFGGQPEAVPAAMKEH